MSRLTDCSRIAPSRLAPALILTLATMLANCGGGDQEPPSSRQDVAPLADAGATQSVQVGATVSLNGSASSDADHDPLTFGAGGSGVMQGARSAPPRRHRMQHAAAACRCGSLPQ